MMSRRMIPLTLAALALACAEIVHPTRSNFYDWRLVRPFINDTLSFNWPQGQTVRIWVEDTLDLPLHTEAGIQTWKDQLLYQEWDATLVADSTVADVLVGVSIPPAAVQAVRLGASAPECRGVTEFAAPPPDSILILPFHVRITPTTIDLTSPAAMACYRLTVAHELGHTMGLFVHSSNSNDLMFTDPVVSQPSARDRNTVQQLYHVDSDLQASR